MRACFHKRLAGTFANRRSAWSLRERRVRSGEASGWPRQGRVLPFRWKSFALLWHHDIIAAVKQHGLCLSTPAAFARTVQTARAFKWKCRDGCWFSLKETEGGGNPRLRTAGRKRGSLHQLLFESPGSRPSVYYWDEIRESPLGHTLQLCGLSLTAVNHPVSFKSVHILKHFQL